MHGGLNTRVRVVLVRDLPYFQSQVNSIFEVCDGLEILKTDLETRARELKISGSAAELICSYETGNTQQKVLRKVLYPTLYSEDQPVLLLTEARVWRFLEQLINLIEKYRQYAKVVMLIDEIDKAEPELANALLEVFGQGAFRVPCLPHEIRADQESPAPLVIITTNEERELPLAFLRRCLLLQLALPTADEILVEYLRDRGVLHFPEFDPNLCAAAARQLARDRREARDVGQPVPGQAEYLDLLRVLTRLQTEKKDPAQWLHRIHPYTLRKGPEARQQQKDDSEK